MGLGGLPMWVRRQPSCAGEGKDTLTVVPPAQPQPHVVWGPVHVLALRLSWCEFWVPGAACSLGGK